MILKWWWTASSCAMASRRGWQTVLKTALKLADGRAFVDPADTPKDEAPAPAKAKKAVLQNNAPEGRIVFSEKFACPVSGFTLPDIEPRLFSFNAPQGACPACDGSG